MSETVPVQSTLLETCTKNHGKYHHLVWLFFNDLNGHVQKLYLLRFPREYLSFSPLENLPSFPPWIYGFSPYQLARSDVGDVVSAKTLRCFGRYVAWALPEQLLLNHIYIYIYIFLSDSIFKIDDGQLNFNDSTNKNNDENISPSKSSGIAHSALVVFWR